MVDERPVSSLLEVLDDMFEHLVMNVIWTTGKLGKSDDRIANVRTAGDVRVEKFTKECAIRKLVVVLKTGMLFRAFRGTGSEVQRFNAISGEGGEAAISVTWRWSGPTMGFADAINVSCTM